MKKKILIAVIAISAATLILSTTIITAFFYRTFTKSEESSLSQVLDASAEAYLAGGITALEAFRAKPYRLTLIASDGRVLFDTKIEAFEKVENHLDREEVQKAFNSSNGKGISTRRSATMLSKTLNIAKRLYEKKAPPSDKNNSTKNSTTPTNKNTTPNLETPIPTSSRTAPNYETATDPANKNTAPSYETSPTPTNTSTTPNLETATASTNIRTAPSYETPANSRAISSLDNLRDSGDSPVVLRISLGTATAASVFLSVLPHILAVFIIAIVLCVALAKVFSEEIVQPINNLDLTHPLSNDTYEEIAPLLLRINKQNDQIATQIATLRQRELEFTKITGCMKEGLLLLNKALNIISINEAAKAIFLVEGEVGGASLQSICHDYEVTKAVESALVDGHAEVVRDYEGRKIQLDATRLKSGEEVAGVVILLFDVTEKIDAQNFRRQFTANVSHELKTPLQGILGSAELLEKGMVKEADTPRFLGHIKTEAQRLIALVEDVINLSALDEKVNFPTQSVELLALSKSVAKDLEHSALEKKVDVKVLGEKISVSGSPKLLCEVLYNLLDNAIKYNREGGTVTVTLGRAGQKAVIKVSDTGQGISSADAEHVFERFYRADKSHSSATEGTGLGLAIARHAVEFHKGKISLQSKPGEGSTFTVELPQ